MGMVVAASQFQREGKRPWKCNGSQDQHHVGDPCDEHRGAGGGGCVVHLLGDVAYAMDGMGDLLLVQPRRPQHAEIVMRWIVT